MLDFSTIIDRVVQHRKLVISLCGLIGVSLSLLYVLHDRTATLEMIEMDIDNAAEDIRLVQADRQFFAEYQSKSGELNRILQRGVKDMNDALATIASHAQSHGLFAVNYEAAANQRLWEGDGKAIDEAGITLAIQTTHESQVFAFLDTLASDWGGQLFVQELDFSRASTDESSMLISADITMQWRRLVRQ